MQRLGRALCLAVTAVVVLACGSVAISAGPVAISAGPVAISAGPVATATGPLVTVTSRGGECAAGPCGMTVIVERDGRVHQAAKPPNDLGTVPTDQLAALDTLIRTTDFAAIKSHPFTGQCPTAYDGQEIVYTFGAPGGDQRIATCEVAVDFGLPLFEAVSTALGPFIP